MASQEDKNAILSSLRPIFPQFSDKVIRESIEIVRGTVGEIRELLIPACIDYLLARPTAPQQRNGKEPTRAIVIEDETSTFEANNSRRKRISDLEVSYVEEFDDNELLYIATKVQNGDKQVYLIDDSPPLAARSDDVIITTRPSCKYDRINDSATTSQLINVEKLQDSATCSTSRRTTTTSSSVAPASTSPVLDPLTYAANSVKNLFPDIQEKYLKELIERWQTTTVDNIINNVCNHLLENGSYPKAEQTQTKLTEKLFTEDKVDYLKNYKGILPSSRYIDQCLILLENEFPKVSVLDIRNIARRHTFHYAPTRKCLEDKLIEAYALKSSKVNSSPSPSLIAEKASKTTGTPLRLLKGRRNPRKLESLKSLEVELQKEIDFIKHHKVSEAEEKDRQLAFTLNEKEYEDEGQMIECGCCYVEATFEDMVQCLDGHLFCVGCLRNYAKEAVFGQGKATLSCMTSDCNSIFSMTQLSRSLESNILAKYEDRLAEESLCLAEMDDLVRCPHCDFAAIMAPEDKVFKCQNLSCSKETCRYCKEEWKEHFGLKCSELEKKDEMNVRLSYEEKMTMAKIRKCHKCGCEFTKSDGCNKMTCRCGTTMCYVCRKPSISYSHFCQHPRDPGHKCRMCSSCSLWSDPSEDDDMAVKQLEQEANTAKRQIMDTSHDNPTPSKKPKTSNESINFRVQGLVNPQPIYQL